MDKVLPSLEEAIADIKDGAMIAIPGFFACGVPRALLQALIRKGTKNLTLACGCGPMLGAAQELKALTLARSLRKSSILTACFAPPVKAWRTPSNRRLGPVR